MATEKVSIVVSVDEKGSINTLGRLKTAVAGLGLAAGALGVALGVDAVKRAIAFEKQMANVSTLLADGQKVTDEFKDSVRDLIRTLPVKPEGRRGGDLRRAFGRYHGFRESPAGS
jgi:hypothetical protein